MPTSYVESTTFVPPSCSVYQPSKLYPVFNGFVVVTVNFDLVFGYVTDTVWLVIDELCPPLKSYLSVLV